MLLKPTNGSNADYAARVGAVIDFLNAGNYPFPATQVPSADANTLDDYEEGTFTPSLAASSGSVTYTARIGRYTKIGNVVTIAFWIWVNVNSALTGATSVSGLPFASSATDARPSCFCMQNAMSGVTGIVAGLMVGSATTVALQTLSNGARASTDGARFANTSDINGSFHYYV